MPDPSYFQKALLKGYTTYSKDVGKALIHMGTIGWIFSALAQVTMIARNDKITKKDKKFLIPQEVADGIVNVGLYYTICQGLKTLGDRLCERGGVILDSTDKIIGKIKGDHQTVQNYIKGMGEDLLRAKLTKAKQKKTPLSAIFSALIKDFENVKSCRTMVNSENSYFFKDNPILKTNTDKEVLLEAVKKAQSEFKANKNGIGVIAAIGGSVLACNLITPVCRNLVANGFQKRYVKKGTPATVYPTVMSNTFNTFKM